MRIETVQQAAAPVARRGAQHGVPFGGQQRMLDQHVDAALEEPARERGALRAARRAADGDARDAHVVGQCAGVREDGRADPPRERGRACAALPQDARDAIRARRGEPRRVELPETGAGHDDRQRMRAHRASFKCVSTNAAVRQSKWPPGTSTSAMPPSAWSRQ